MTALPSSRRQPESGIALLAVLFALTLLLLLALPFAVSMGAGADAAVRDVEQAAVRQASASARDQLLADAALSHPAIDQTPHHDGLDEFPGALALPPAFAPLREEGKVLLGGEVEDLQRKLALDGASPLVLANLLGTASRLREALEPDGKRLLLEDAEALPDSGYLWVAHEVVRYGQKQGNDLLDLQRGQFQELGFARPEQTIVEGALVLDYRCVLAAAWPFLGRGDGQRRVRRAYAAVGELAEVAAGGVGAFTAVELDALAASLCAEGQPFTTPTWGRPERVFADLQPGQSRTLRVKSALHLGPGSTVRLRHLRSGAVEYNLVMATSSEQFATDLLLPAVFQLDLLFPVLQEFPALDTVVEPLVPAPVNVNTAALPTLVAILRELRRAVAVRVAEADGNRRAAPPPGSGRGLAQELAEQLVALRQGDGDTPGTGPFTGWQDLVERVFRPRFEAASSDPQRNALVYVYRNLLTGRDSSLEMGTAPLCFASGPLVAYRAAASRSRSVVAPAVAARHERSGTALAVPGLPLEHAYRTQEQLEEAFALDRRAQFYGTFPVNLGGGGRGGGGDDPGSRHIAHVVPLAFPGLGLGAPRFAGRDPADSGFAPLPASARPGNFAGEVRQYDALQNALDPRGHDVGRGGAYLMQNSGPSQRAGQPGQGGQPGNPTGNSQGQPVAGAGTGSNSLAFPFANAQSFVTRFATSFWAEPQSLGVATLFDHSAGDPNRNRISLLARDGNLVFEVLDEAGLDPNPSASPAGVPRTAAEWQLPLAELGLPADTPVHLSVSAYGSRPGDLSVAVDGVTRGRTRYRTYLAQALPVLDPALTNNSGALPPTAGSERYLNIAVESTDGFPPQGVLRIGTELFEYTGIAGNTFQCQFRDSIGGRAARMIGREYRPNIPLDAAGNPTVDIDALQQQGVNLDVFPAHPVGAEVELYGYSALLSEDTGMMVGSTRLDGALGGFAVARGFVPNPRPISITAPPLPPITLGNGLDATWAGNLELADPVPTRNYPPAPAQQPIADAFPAGGGYALLVQRLFDFQSNFPGQISTNAVVGGVELIRYQARQGTRLVGVQRAQTVPGIDNQLDPGQYNAQARQFVCDWTDWSLPGNNSARWDDVPTLILWVVPVSLAVQNPNVLWDPTRTMLTEWLQLHTQGSPNETEWVRYDAIVDGRHVVRGNRAAWESTRFTLTQSVGAERVQVGQLGPNTGPNGGLAPPWGQVTPTSGFIGYTPQLESTFPQIRAARNALRFRGDPFTGTSSHPQNNAQVTACHRLQLDWGNFGAFTGRCGRHDRIALVQGSVASGSTRPAVEWHTVTWAARRYGSDNLQQNQRPPERLGAWPFQLVGFQDGVQGAYLGPNRNTVATEPRLLDRVVKFPSGELPAAHCPSVHWGSGVGNQQPIQGFVDEIEVVQHEVPGLVVEEPFDAGANTFRVLPGLTWTAAGPVGFANDLSATLPPGGGLLLVDGEILAYQSRSNGQITVATNGRGLLNTEPRGHDRGARVQFLTHRAAAILQGGVSQRDHRLPLQSRAALPRAGTVLLGRELLHYAWTRVAGDQVTLEMPRHFPPGEGGDPGSARGLFRARFGTAAQSAAAGEAVIGFPFRYWDRYVERSDDPELAYFQLTANEAPSFFQSVRWREETRDPRVQVVCLGRLDGRAGWTDEPNALPGLWQWSRRAEADTAHRIDASGTRLELRFATVYRPGVLDLATFRAHGWKTTARVEQVRVEYEGQGRVLAERETGR